MAQPVGVRHDASRPSMLAVGTMVWLASELMFFSGLFAAYFSLRSAAPTWPPHGVELDALRGGIFTVVLVASSGTMQLAVWAAERGERRRARGWVVVTALMALVFIGNQASEWLSLDFTPSTHAYGSIFYLLTGFHGIHVLGGVVAMGALLARTSGTADDPGAVPVVQVIGYYWHFVDVVWIAVFATVFLVK
ncbi:MAG: aa3-type cytochrome oxidase subunit III [Acidimicrobiales bacterium]